MCFAVVQEPRQVVSSIPGMFSHSDVEDKAVDTFDVLVCGGTLGIFIATALSSKGLRVGIVERNILKGVYTILWSSSKDNL
jgi:ribulose 1,5-bisphosphate synthetase/thiazole synthase